MRRTWFGFVRSRGATLSVAAVVAVLPLLASVPPTRAALTFTVNRAFDLPDFDPADNRCDVNEDPGNVCTLRAAIQQANASPGEDTIEFAIPGDGLHTIRPTSQLPPITGAVTIDGYTQPGARQNTLDIGTNAQLRIELDGSAAGVLVDGLWIEAPNSLIRGLAINRFVGNGVRITGPRATNTRIAGCFLGTNAAGTLGRGNIHGVLVDADDVYLGGAIPAARNLVSGNALTGVVVAPGVTGLTVFGNLVGTDRDATANLGNGGAGVSLDPGADDNTIGGASDGMDNTIAFNRDDGVVVAGGAAGNRILRNALFFNGGEGIDLNDDGPTANDLGDTDDGANRSQNTPVLFSARPTGAATTVSGRLNSTANRSFVLRFFSNPTGNEGRVFRGELAVTTNALGNAPFTFPTERAIPVGHMVTATATSASTGDTSEFSLPVTAS